MSQNAVGYSILLRVTLLNRFSEFYQPRLNSEFATKSSLQNPTHLKRVATLPYEISGTFLTWFLCHPVITGYPICADLDARLSLPSKTLDFSSEAFRLRIRLCQHFPPPKLPRNDLLPGCCHQPKADTTEDGRPSRVLLMKMVTGPATRSSTSNDGNYSSRDWYSLDRLKQLRRAIIPTDTYLFHKSFPP